jgi:hypothetical protein
MWLLAKVQVLDKVDRGMRIAVVVGHHYGINELTEMRQGQGKH